MTARKIIARGILWAIAGAMLLGLGFVVYTAPRIVLILAGFMLGTIVVCWALDNA